MIIKRLVMRNFRQFIDTEIEFSTDEEKNITIIMGNNGTGKTTLAQAFLWCFYGNTSFQNKEVLNGIIKDKLPAKGQATVAVSVDLSYDNKDYSIERKQVFKKAQNKVEETPARFAVSYKVKGNTCYLDDTDAYYFIKRMLPEALSRFFFFDGERIKIMSDEINHGQSREFKEAVTGLVGLKSIQNTLLHFKPMTGSGSANNSVIGYYRKMVRKSGNEDVREISSIIEQKEEIIEKAQQRKEEIEPQLDSYLKELVEIKAKVMSMTPELERKKEYENAERELSGLENRRKELIKNTILQKFGSGLYSFVSLEMIERVEKELEKIKEVPKELPVGVERPTVEYLLKRGRCLCGEELKPGTEHFKAVYDLLEIVPPKTIGSLIQESRERGKLIRRSGETFFADFSEQVKSLGELDDRIERTLHKRDELFEILTDTSEGERAKKRLAEIEREIPRLNKELLEKEAIIKNAEAVIGEKNKELSRVASMQEDYKRYMRYLTYAERIYNDFSKRYDQLEAETRERMEKKINEIFPQIYDGGLKIELDEKYNIRVLLDDERYSSGIELEKNMGQSQSVIFAFITSIIAMAKEKALEDSEGSEEEKAMFAEAEGYPLVMDAPLSDFDKRRIEQICTIIPTIAKQVIFFIKDTDGEVAEAHMSQKIGKKYCLTELNGSKMQSIVEEM